MTPIVTKTAIIAFVGAISLTPASAQLALFPHLNAPASGPTWCVSPADPAVAVRCDILPADQRVAWTGNVYVLEQVGNNNASLSGQTGSTNVTLVQQRGDSNTSTVLQDGESNFAGVSQDGSNNAASIDQQGSRHYSESHQTGDGSTVTVIQRGW